jgi:hypothetical protein
MILPKHLQEADEVSTRLILLAGEGEATCSKEGCLILFGLMRECGYRLRLELDRCRHGTEGRRPPRSIKKHGGAQELVLVNGMRNPR